MASGAQALPPRGIRLVAQSRTAPWVRRRRVLCGWWAVLTDREVSIQMPSMLRSAPARRSFHRQRQLVWLWRSLRVSRSMPRSAHARRPL